MTNSSAARIPPAIEFLGRVRFTMVLLIVGAIVMIVGTIIESQSGAEVARATVYQTLWFDAYLLLIGINLVMSVIVRLPIRRNQWAFVLTHASVVLLLVGAWISRTYGYEGRLSILEGSTESRIYTEGEELRVAWRDQESEALRLQTGDDPSGRVLPAAASDAPEVRVESFVPSGMLETKLVEAESSGAPGVIVRLDGYGLAHTECLIGESPSFRRRDLGTIDLEIVVLRSAEALEQRLEARTGVTATVRIRVAEDQQPVVIKIPDQVSKDYALAPGLIARVHRFMKHAQVQAGELNENPSAPVNPAAIVEIRGEEHTETHTVFGEFPQFNLVRGRGEAEPLVAEVVLQAPTTTSKPLTSIIVDAENDQLYVQLSAGADRGPGLAFEPGGTVGIGNLELDMKVLEFLPSSRPRLQVRPGTGDEAEPWMELSASFGARETSGWVNYGSSLGLEFGDELAVVTWGPAQRELPFSVALEDFQVDYHPGSMRPSQYQSRIRIHGPDGADVPALVSMNRPLDHAGFRLFQSSYRLRVDGHRDLTVLQVSKDPGVALVYPSFILLIIGVGWYLVGHGRRRRAVAEGSPQPAVSPAAR